MIYGRKASVGPLLYSETTFGLTLTAMGNRIGFVIIMGQITFSDEHQHKKCKP